MSVSWTRGALGRLVVREVAYPGLLLGSLVLAWSLGAGRAGEGLAGGLAVSGSILLAGLVLLGLERLAPFSPRWRVPLGGRAQRVDALHTASTAVTALLVEAVAWGGLVALGARAASALGAPLWPGGWPLALQVALGLVVGEAGTYAVHRACHATALGWRIHAMHHSSDRLNLLASGRNHPFNAALSYLTQMGPLALLGAGGPVIALCAVFKAVNGLAQHANVDTRSAWLGWVLATPELHRWHHALDLRAGNSNFGNNLIVWDLLLGTRHAPPGERPTDAVGVAGVRWPEGFLGQLATPFAYPRWVTPPGTLAAEVPCTSPPVMQRHAAGRSSPPSSS